MTSTTQVHWYPNISHRQRLAELKASLRQRSLHNSRREFSLFFFFSSFRDVATRIPWLIWSFDFIPSILTGSSLLRTVFFYTDYWLLTLVTLNHRLYSVSHLGFLYNSHIVWSDFFNLFLLLSRSHSIRSSQSSRSSRDHFLILPNSKWSII